MKPSIVPRENMDFGLDQIIPKYWVDNEPFKTRFFDALSTLFPDGERYFINCVRYYRDQITDPELAQQVSKFMRQEAQHGIVHAHFNSRLREQGIAADVIGGKVRKRLERARRRLPPKLTLANTAAAEHFTAIMCHCFFEDRALLENADPRIRAMYAWHSAEEIEHKAVAFDVLQRVARAGYFIRIFGLLITSLMFPLHVLLIMAYMLKTDGFSFRQRVGLWLRGMWWMFRPGGLIAPVLPLYFAYYKPGFHPWKHSGQMRGYKSWLEVYERTGDPIEAGNAMFLASAGI